jgi:hypothetical protein
MPKVTFSDKEALLFLVGAERPTLVIVDSLDELGLWFRSGHLEAELREGVPFEPDGKDARIFVPLAQIRSLMVYGMDDEPESQPGAPS